MGEIFHALEVLNRTMNLGLNAKQLLRAEMGFKSAYALVSNPDPVARKLANEDPVALAEGFELVATLRPRAQKLSLEQLSNFAGQAAGSPKMRVSPQTFAQIDQKLNAPVRNMNINPTNLGPTFRR